MEQNDRGNYRTHESLAHEFVHSCLGKIIILAVFIGALLVIGHFTIPDEETMMAEMTDNIRQCIADNDSTKTDWIDDAVNNVGYIFTHADSVINEDELKELLEKIQKLTDDYIKNLEAVCADKEKEIMTV